VGTLYHIKNIQFQKLVEGSYRSITTAASLSFTDFSFTDTALTSGLNSYRLQVTLNNEQVVYSDVITVFHFTNTDVIIYPNPAPQGAPVNIITSKAGRATIQIFNVAGVPISTMLLRELSQQVPAVRLPKGTYFVKIKTDNKTSTQKLIVY
jgi:hypothetical protein